MSRRQCRAGFVQTQARVRTPTRGTAGSPVHSLSIGNPMRTGHASGGLWHWLFFGTRQRILLCHLWSSEDIRVEGRALRGRGTLGQEEKKMQLGPQKSAAAPASGKRHRLQKNHRLGTKVSKEKGMRKVVVESLKFCKCSSISFLK